MGYGVIGNTTDSGPVFSGSSPDTPTKIFRNDMLGEWIVAGFVKRVGYGVIGNTTDSGPVFSGSSPDTPTKISAITSSTSCCGFFVYCYFCVSA